MGDESKDNAPDRETAEGGLATLVDQVKDEHLVQVEDHPGDYSGCWSMENICWDEKQPWEAADEESGDDGDEHQGQPLLSTSPSSALSHLRKVKCHPV